MSPHQRSHEIAAAVGALRRFGIIIDDPMVADELAATIIAEVEAVKRRGSKVLASQCGAITLSGWPCRNTKRPGHRGCSLHPEGK